MILGFLLGAALGGEVDDWKKLQDALLSEAAYADLPQATASYQLLARNLSVENPVRVEALYRLGAAQYAIGAVEESRTALREGIRSSTPGRVRCLELLSQIELEENSIRSVPIEWTFDHPKHGFVHPARYADRGSTRIDSAAPGGDPALQWTTTVDGRRDDILEIGFNEPSPSPRGFRFSIRSASYEARIRIYALDVYGRRFLFGNEPGTIEIPKEKWRLVEVHLEDLEPLDPGGPLVPADIDRIIIQDVTAFFERAAGFNSLHIDDFVVYN